MSSGTAIVIVLAALCAVLLVLAALERRRAVRALDTVSAILQKLLDMRSDPVVDETFDTLPSRIQAQASRLIELRAALRRGAREDRDNIQSLISDITHQLKTPVAGVRLYGEMIAGGAEDNEHRARLLEALDTLTFLTESLVKLSRLEGGVIRLAPKEESLYDVVLDAIARVWQAAEAKGVTIEAAEPRARIIVLCDRRWTAEAIFNILDNAVKYSEKGALVKVALSSYEMYARADISDTGPGIPESETQDIFKRFYRGASSEGIEGSGIGLYLTRRILAGEGGYVTVRSHALPQQPAQQPPRTGTPQQHRTGTPQQPRADTQQPPRTDTQQPPRSEPPERAGATFAIHLPLASVQLID
jgi:signal transduction histidine kinase